MPKPHTFALSPPLGAALALLVTCTAIGLPARAGEVEVRFIDPDKFADAGRSNRDRERTLQTLETIAENARAIQAQLAKFLDFEGPQAAQLLNNADWLACVGESGLARTKLELLLRERLTPPVVLPESLP